MLALEIFKETNRRQLVELEDEITHQYKINNFVSSVLGTTYF
jgi:hypothetical protein